MKTYIGPYKRWIGPYQIAEFFFQWEIKEKVYGEKLADKVGDWLSDTWVLGFCQWVEKKRKRKIKVRIDKYDTWSADDTMAHIILPILKQLREHKQGSSFVDDADVPEELRSTFAPPVPNHEVDGNHHRRWAYVLNEMIFAFENIVDDSWEDKFYTGEHDVVWVPQAGTNSSVMTKGPKDTFKVDNVGLAAYNARIDNGTRLFGKYYRCLWT